MIVDLELERLKRLGLDEQQIKRLLNIKKSINKINRLMQELKKK